MTTQDMRDGPGQMIYQGASDTDWQAEIFNEAALLQDYNLSISGGADKSKVYFNLNNTKTRGHH